MIVDPNPSADTWLDGAFDFSRLASLHGEEAVLQFERCGYVPLPGLLTKSGLEGLRSEVERLLPTASRKDFLMECMGNTPRHMSTLGGLTITERAPAIAALYHDDALQAELGRILGRRLLPADDPVERHVLNVLHEKGDTHGFHIDDYPVALVVFIESPTCPDGCGMLEFCPVGDPSHTVTRSHQAGDAYLLRSDSFDHRVQPIHDGCRRTVLNFAFGMEGVDISPTPSASLLYD